MIVFSNLLLFSEIETDGHRDAAFKLVFSNTHPLTGNNGAETAQKEHYIVV